MNHPSTDRPPRLNQSFDAEKASGASIWNNPITRRSFLKRSGAVTAGIIVTSQLMRNEAIAAEFNIEIASINFSCNFSIVDPKDDGKSDEKPSEPGVSFYKMKCISPEKNFAYGGLNGKEIDTDPCGWKEISIKDSSTGQIVKKWHRIFAQCVAIPSKLKDTGLYNEIKIGYIAKGRCIAIPCGYEGDEVDLKAPPTHSKSGIGSWTDWYTFIVEVVVFCNSKDGNITSQRLTADDGDTFHDGNKIWTTTSLGGNVIEFSAKFTTKWGGSSDDHGTENIFEKVQIQ